MAGTREGGRKAAQTNKDRYGEKFYEGIGRKGGKMSTGGGFAADRKFAAEMGRIGGKAHRSRKRERRAWL